ncbi:MAG: hypothetical protein J6B13_03485 [Muribaculaceae bacterium]|nr:hypothetical protein [Muribaculaceae bacterium]
MKKILLILALALATALPSVAESKFIGQEDTNEYSLPVDLGAKWSASQSLYTSSELDGLYDVANNKTANITAITGYVNVANAYWLYSVTEWDVTLYIKNVDETAFTMQNGKAVPVEFITAVSGKFSFNESLLEQDGYLEAIEGYNAALPVKIVLDEPLQYNGKSLLLTWMCHFADYDTDTCNNGCMSWTPGSGVRTLIWCNSRQELTADKILAVGSTNDELSILPNITIEYEMVDLPSESTVERLPDTDFAVGPYDEPVREDASLSCKDVLPVAMCYKYSGSQTLYTPVQLDGITKVDQSAEISSVSFKLNFEEGLINAFGSFNVKCFVKVLDDVSAFPKNASGDMKWFEYSTDDAMGEFELDSNQIEPDSEWEYAYSWGMGGQFDITLSLNKPVELKYGQSLLITWIAEVQDVDGEWTNSTASFAVAGNEKLAMSIADDGKTFESYYNAGETNAQLTYNYLPVLKLHYTPLVYKDAEPKNQVSFESVVPMVRRMTVDPAISESTEYGVSDFKRIDAVNGVSLAYTIKDEQAGEGKQYEISLNNEPLATVSELSGIINFVDPAPKQDMRLMVTPTDANSVGLPTTVAKADIEALLPQYEVSVVKSKYYMTDGEGDKKNIHAAAKFQFGVPEDIMASVTVSSPTVASSRKLLHNGDVGDEYTIDFDPEFLSLDADNWSCLHLNDRCVSFFYPNVMEGSMNGGELVIPNKSFSSSINSTVKYSLAWAAKPKIEEGVAVTFANDYDVDLALARELSIKSVEKTASNSGYNGVSFVLDPPQASDLSGIESVEVDGNAAVEYFNLQGVRVENPQSGLFIRRQGNKAAKVYVK